MLQHSSQGGRHRLHATDGDAQFAVIHRAHPIRRLGNVKKCGFCVEHYSNSASRRNPKLPYEVVVVGIEYADELSAKAFGCILALIAQRKMTALPL